jgi:hypothetical protein
METLMLKMLSSKQIIIVAILVAIALNALSFCFAYPEISKPQSATSARDFSAYYTGAYRLIRNPTKIYFDGTQPGDYPILPQPQTFKYTPSFLVLFAPFLSMDYLTALNVFDFVQLALIPVLAFFVYKLVKDKNYILGAIAAFIILIQPLPTPSINVPYAPLINLGLFSVNSQSFAPSYYCGYFFVNAHILQTVLLVGALYLGFVKKPLLSALLFSFGLLDPRAAIVALPLLLWYNRQEIRKFIIAATAFILATNLPFFLYYGIGSTFLRTEINSNIISQSYAYDWIPIYGVVALNVVEIITVVLKKRKSALVYPRATVIQTMQLAD